MLELSNLNYLAILLATVINCGLGALWYSPIGFVKRWEEYTGIDIMQIPQNEANKILMYVVGSALTQSAVLAIIVRSIGAVSWMEEASVGLVLWLGFIAAATVGVTLYSRRSWKFWWLNSSYFLIVMVINAAILAVWQ